MRTDRPLPRPALRAVPAAPFPVPPFAWAAALAPGFLLAFAAWPSSCARGGEAGAGAEGRRQKPAASIDCSPAPISALMQQVVVTLANGERREDAVTPAVRRWYLLAVPEGAARLSVTVRGPGGDDLLDLGINGPNRPGPPDCVARAEYASLSNTSHEGMVMANPASGTWFFLVQACGDGGKFTIQARVDMPEADWPPAPTFDPPGGDFDDVVAVTLSAPEPAFLIGYSLDGVPPTPRSGQYAKSGDAVPIARTRTLRARSFVVGDGMSRLVTGRYVLDGSPLERRWTFVAAADFNGDGKADTLWRDPESGRTLMGFMDGARLAAEVFTAPQAGPVWTFLAAGDLDGDGKADLVLRALPYGPVRVWRMNGPGLLDQGELAEPPPRGRDFAALADFDGDGKADFLWREAATGRLFVQLMDGRTTRALVELGERAGADWTLAAVAGYDGDGRADVWWRAPEGARSAVWLMDGAGSAERRPFPVGPAEPGPEWSPLAAADFDGDGRVDVLWRHPETGAARIGFLRADPDANPITVHEPTTPQPGADWVFLAHGDFDGDSRADLVWRDPGAGRAVYWLMNGAAATYAGPARVEEGGAPARKP